MAGQRRQGATYCLKGLASMTDQAELSRPRMADKIQTINPATEEPGRSYEQNTIDEARTAAEAAHRAFREWRRTSLDHRAAVIRKAADVLRARKDEFAALMTDEMGKTLDEGLAEIEKCAFHCDWFAEHTAEYLADQPVDIGVGEAFVTFNPIGVVLAVMPWNFPFWQVFRFAAPALMAGNGALLKHASNVPGCALAIEEVLHQAGVPHDLASEPRGGGADKRREYRRRDPDRQRQCGPERRDCRWLGAQEMRSRARWVRRLLDP